MQQMKSKLNKIYSTQVEEFETLYDEAVKTRNLIPDPPGPKDNPRFSGPHKQKTVWYNHWLSFLISKYGQTKAYDKKYWTRENFKKCIEDRRLIRERKMATEEKELQILRKNWGGEIASPITFYPELFKEGLMRMLNAPDEPGFTKIKASESESVPALGSRLHTCEPEYTLLKYLHTDSNELDISNTNEFIQYIKDSFSKSKPQRIAELMAALVELKCISQVLVDNNSIAHRVFTELLGPIGTEEGHRIAKGKLNNSGTFEKAKIDVIVRDFKKHFSLRSSN